LVKNFPIAAKFLTILDVLSVSIIVATNEMTAGVRRLTAGFLGGAWLFMADGAASKPAMPGRLSCHKSMIDSALNHATSVLPVCAGSHFAFAVNNIVSFQRISRPE